MHLKKDVTQVKKKKFLSEEYIFNSVLKIDVIHEKECDTYLNV